MTVNLWFKGVRCEDNAVPADAAAAATPAAATGGGGGGAEDKTTAAATFKEATDNVRSSLAACGQQLMKSGSDAVDATELVLKAFGRVAMAAVGLLVAAWNGASLSTAAAGLTVAGGARTVNGVTETLPVVGTVTAGVQNALAAVAGTYRENAAFNSDQRNKLMADMQAKLDGFRSRDDKKTDAPAADPAAAAPQS